MVENVRLNKLLSAPSSCVSMMSIYAAVYKRILPRGRTVFINSMPKSGSTFLSVALRNTTGFRYASSTFAFGQHEQDLYLPLLIDHQFRDTVTRHHTPANDANIGLMERFDISPVILVRNIFDVIVSVRDHLHKAGLRSFPSLYPTEAFLEMSEDEQISYLISCVAPWYLQFYVGWYEAWRQQRRDMLWLRYEDVVEDWPAAIDRILEFNGIDKSPSEIRAALERSYSDDYVRLRRNRVVTGRGRERLDSAQCERVRELARMFPDVDFSFIGIESTDASASIGPAA